MRAISLPRRTILIVDDSETDRHIARRFLRRDSEYEYIVMEEGTGEGGLTRCRSERFDCVLLDYHMPDMDGLEFLGKLVGTHIPVVMLTGSGNEAVAVAAMKTGAQDYLVKGRVSPEALQIAVDNAIEKVRLQGVIEAQRRDLERQNAELQQRQDEIEALNVQLRRSITETHHRVKNNLQVIGALVDMLLMDTPDSSAPADDLRRLGESIRTLATIHDLLTHQSKQGGGSEENTLSAKEVLDKLVPLMQQTAVRRAVRYHAADARLTARQVAPLAMVANELVSNAVKHGRGEVGVNFAAEGKQAKLTVEDDGAGFPDGFDPARAANTGLELVLSLARHDLSGAARFENREEGGGRVVLEFPVEEPAVQFADLGG